MATTGAAEAIRLHSGKSVRSVEASIDRNDHVYVFEDGKWTHNGHDLKEAMANPEATQ